MAATADPAVYGPKAGLLVPQPAVTRGVAAIISASPCGKYLLYTNGTCVVVRSIEDPSFSFVYSEHAAPVKVAKFAPTGKYVASGDAAGKVRVWAFTTAEHNLKFECAALGGEVEDIAWDSEAKRILAVGAGSSKAKVFMWDTGSQLAEIIPHSKKVLSGDFKPTRPFKLVMGGEDFNMSFYTGPPFKYEKGLKEHSNFVNCVRYAPDGSKFVSVSSDKKAVVYDGTTAAVVGQLDPAVCATAGSIYHCSWCPTDSKRLATAHFDKTIRIWDMTPTAAEGAAVTFKCEASLPIGSGAGDVQNSVTWAAEDLIVSLSLDGTLNFLRPSTAAVAKRVTGHVEPMNCLDYDAKTGYIVSGDNSGRVCVWAPVDEARTRFVATVASGDVPAKKASGVAVAGSEVAVIAWDDKLRIGDLTTGVFQPAVTLPGQPRAVAVTPSNPSLRVVITSSAILLFNGAKQAAKVDAPWTPTCVDMSADGALVAVGGQDAKVHFFVLNAAAGTLTDDGETAAAGGAISAVAISPDDKLVVVGDAVRDVRLYKAQGAHEVVVSGRWMNHTTRVTGAKWSPDGRHIATVSSDRRICIWEPSNEHGAKVVMDLAHPQPLAAVAWADPDTIWTLGIDGVAVRRTLTL